MWIVIIFDFALTNAYKLKALLVFTINNLIIVTAWNKAESSVIVTRDIQLSQVLADVALAL